MAYSILIVDDDRTFVEELKSALQWNRLRITEVYTAFSVREAIAFLSKTKADIVLCDIEMPGGNGLQLLKWIRENHASMECIVLSSYAEFSYAQSALRFDVCDYLLKPIKAKELEETISRVVGLLDARRGWQEEPLETLWAALFDGAVKQADFTRQAQKHGLTENSSLAILLLRFVPVPGQPVPSHYGRPLVRQAILDLADQNALQTVVRLSETRWILVCRATGKDPFPRAPLAAFLDAVEARIGLQVCAYCGEKGTVGQAVSMWEALCQLEKHTVPDMQRIAQGVDLPADKTQRRSFPLKTWKKMLVGFGPLTSLEASIREEMVRVQAEEGWTVNRLTVFLRTCTLMLSNYLQSRDMSLEDIIDSEEYDQMETFAVSSLCATAWFMHKILGIVEGSRDHKSDAITTVPPRAGRYGTDRAALGPRVENLPEGLRHELGQAEVARGRRAGNSLGHRSEPPDRRGAGREDYDPARGDVRRTLRYPATGRAGIHQLVRGRRGVPQRLLLAPRQG